MLVLGMLFLRALIPAGFMLASVDGALAVVLCEPDVLESTVAHHDAGHDHAGHDHSGHEHAAHDHTGHAHHAGHDHAGPDLTAHQHGAHGDPSCPYAQSAGSAPLPTLPVVAAVGPLHRLASPPALTQTSLSFGPPRQPVSRGPPTLL
jgi:hypothetical protein